MKKKKEEQEADPGEVIQYRNTDLCLESKADVAKLVEYFEKHHISTLYGSLKGGDGLWYASFETDTQHTEPEATIAEMLAAVEALPEALRKIWAGCAKREFDIGYDCGAKPSSFDQGLSEKLVTRIAAAGASIRITIYR